MTLWLEGFAKDPNAGGIHFTQQEIDTAGENDPAYQKTTADWKVEPQPSNWWNFEQTIGKEIAAGFELTAVKTNA